MNIMWVFIGGGIGSVLRFLISSWMKNASNHFPWGTFTVNLLACSLLALLVYHLPNDSQYDWAKLLLLTGLCGGFSTFSTFSLETLQLMQNGQWLFAILYILGSVIGSLVCLYSLQLRS